MKTMEAGVAMQFDEVAMHDDGPHTSIVSKFPLRDGRVESMPSAAL